MRPIADRSCSSCGHATHSRRCPDCRCEGERAGRFRFSGAVVALLAALALVAVLAARRASPRSPAAPAAAAEPRPSPEPRAAYAPAGSVPCGYCNGDGRIDDADRYKRTPPRIEAPLGPCPACAGKGGLR